MEIKKPNKYINLKTGEIVDSYYKPSHATEYIDMCFVPNEELESLIKEIKDKNMEKKYLTTYEELLANKGKLVEFTTREGVFKGRLQTEEDNIFLCQNLFGISGNNYFKGDKFGYKYAVRFASNEFLYIGDDYRIKSVELIEDLKIHKPSSDIADCIAYSFKDLDMNKAIDDITPPNEYKQQQFKNKLNDVLVKIELMLTEKNRKYGNSALEPINIFSKLDKIEQLKISIDHKLKRIQNQQQDDIEDSVDDLIGYLILLKIAKKENNE